MISQKRTQNVNLHKTLAGVVRTHHRSIVRAVIGPETRQRVSLKFIDSQIYVCFWCFRLPSHSWASTG